MGKNLNSNLAHGTSGSPQLSQEQSNMLNKVNDIADKRLIDEMERRKYKFTRDNIIFVTKDKSGQIIWLETGKKSAGFEHLLKHDSQLESAFNINRNEIVSYIKKIVSTAKILCTHDDGRGYWKCYETNKKKLLQVIIGYNGFIISAYPCKRKEKKQK